MLCSMRQARSSSINQYLTSHIQDVHCQVSELSNSTQKQSRTLTQRHYCCFELSSAMIGEVPDHGSKNSASAQQVQVPVFIESVPVYSHAVHCWYGYLPALLCDAFSTS